MAIKKISIIIPVYNVEKYIVQCINSALHQDLSENEYEILIIDDESPDHSVDLIRKKFDNIPSIKIISQKNKGLGGARNTGIKNASGEYLLFLDSDDFLLPNVLKELYELKSLKVWTS